MAIDAGNNLYVASSFAGGIFKITPAGAVSSYRTMSGPIDLTFDTRGNLYVVRAFAIDVIAPGGGSLSTYATLTGHPNVYGLAFDPFGNLFVSDETSASLLKIPPGGGSFSNFGTLAAGSMGLVFDDSGFLYAAHPNSSTISKVAANGSSTTFASGLSGARYLAFAPQPAIARRAAGFATALPDGTGNFTSLRGAGLSGEKVAYFGAGGAGQQGIYVSIPSGSTLPPNPVRIANTATAIPGGSGNFTAFTVAAAISGDNVAFLGDGAGGQQGIYRAVIGGSVATIADKNTAIPGGTGAFTSFLPGEPTAPAIDGANVAFFGAGGGGQQGIYVALPGEPTLPIASTATAIPGGSGNFTAFTTAPSLSGDSVAFLGDGAGGQQGIYRATVGGAVATVADKNTAIPGGTGAFTSFFPGEPVAPAIKGARVAFFGAGSGGQRGIYLSLQTGVLAAQDGLFAAQAEPLLAGDLLKIADTATAIPGGTGNFLDFGDVSIDGTDVAFLGFGANGQQGIYDLTGGSLFKVVDLTAILDGRAITGLEFTRNGLSGDSLSFQATFADGSQGVYTAGVVPEPGSLGLLGMAGLLLAGKRRVRTFAALPRR